MISALRTTCPRVLSDKASRWQAELNAASTKSQEEKALNRYRHPQVKEALVEMFHGKCAYCESKITHIDFGHIEHYLPKSGPRRRRDLVFDWNNLLLACGICNGSRFKGCKSPTRQEGGPYINPCIDDPSTHFDFVYDPVAKLSSVLGTTRRGNKTVTDLGLNRSDLRTYRSKLVRKLVCIAQFASTNSEAAAIVREAKESTSAYSAFARALL